MGNRRKAEAEGPTWSPEIEREAERLVRIALDEDVGEGDWTTLWTVDEGREAEAEIVAKETLVLAGTEVARMAFLGVDPGLAVEILVGDGTRIESGTTVLRVRGSARAILTGERTALNFMGRLSGIATLTRRFVDRVKGTGARIVDTRKTTPGWRHLEKWAVRAGGGTNHRMGLYDMVLIKDNHIAAAGGVGEATRRVHEQNSLALPVEVEVVRPEQVEELRGLEVDRILLDNMDDGTLREAVRRVGAWPEPRPELEASGNMSLERVRGVAEGGVHWISVGALTHSVRTSDLSLRIVGSTRTVADPDRSAPA
jgi:nicotinate-nucleotide pyrophosphorylase (carboxylating)